MAAPQYEILQVSKGDKSIQYLFVSKGKSDVVKAIEYSYVQDYRDRKVFNLAFGDYNLKTGEIDDAILTENGDKFPVFYTVLSTVPNFFETFPNAMMIVHGSDSSINFEKDCKKNCTRKCSDLCKKINRRINVYSHYVNKNYAELNKAYIFYGGTVSSDNKVTIELYNKDQKYKVVLVVKK